ncbi:MAG: helix-turn-helix domain-containing protein, partial [Sphaerochaeta sp.]
MVEKIAPTHRTTSRILDIIEYVSQNPGSSLAQISRELCIPKGSLHPLTCTLTERKYLYYKSREERFYPGESLFIYGNKHVNDSDLLERIRSVMLRINEITHETLYFGV